MFHCFLKFNALTGKPPLPPYIYIFMNGATIVPDTQIFRVHTYCLHLTFPGHSATPNHYAMLLVSSLGAFNISCVVI